MSRGKPLIMLIISAAVGLAATAAAAKYLGKKNDAANAAPLEPTTKWVAVAAVKIPEGKEIVATDVKKEEKLIGELPGDAIEQSDLIVGRSAMVPIEEGDVISETKLVPAQEPMSVDDVVAEGYRAMPIRVDSTAGKSDVLSVGLHVDVLAVFETDKRGADPISKTILQNIEVLAVRYDKTRQGKATRDNPTVVLAVLPKDAEKLALAMTKGHIVLVARSSRDTETVKTNGVKTADLGPRPQPAKPPPQPPKPGPHDLLLKAKGLLAAGQQSAGEAILKQLSVDVTGEAGQQARKLLDSMAAERLRRAALGRFEQTREQIEKLIESGAFSAALKKIDEAEQAFAALVTEDGLKAAELLQAGRETVERGQKHARHLYAMVRNFRINGKDDLARKYLAELEASYPHSRYCRTAKQEQ